MSIGSITNFLKYVPDSMMRTHLDDQKVAIMDYWVKLPI